MSSPERSRLSQLSAIASAAVAALGKQGLPGVLTAAAIVRTPAGPPASGAAPRHTALQTNAPAGRTNPPPVVRTLKPVQLTAARLLLAGGRITDVAAALGVHRYTISRWQSDPTFQAELRRQTAAATAAGSRVAASRATTGAAPRHIAPHGATPGAATPRNEPNAEPRYSAAKTRAILAGLPRPVDRADP